MDNLDQARQKIASISRRYDPNHDLFDDPIQVNVTDFLLLKTIENLLDEIDKIKKEQRKMKNFSFYPPPPVRPKPNTTPSQKD